jgi:ribonuclease G
MYNVDDAVARVDSYIVSVTGGGRFVGDRRLVRIESVGRAAATASLVGNGNQPGAESGSAAEGDEGDRASDGEPLESTPSRRRRGRRGGRRRSRAQAQNPSNGE